jgi:dienelactone hydrolase
MRHKVTSYWASRLVSRGGKTLLAAKILRKTAILAALAAFGFCRFAAAADKSSCDLPQGASMRIVEYFNGPPTQPGDHKCDRDKCSLKGWLYVPKNVAAHRKAVVYLHGHEQERHEPCALVAYFLDYNYVVFAPLRSGNIAMGDSKPPKAEFRNTGSYIDDWAKKQDGDFEENRVKYLRDFQTHDVEHAVRFLANLPDGSGKLVSEGRIAVLGHSYGGALSVFSSAGEFNLNPRAIADVSGGELSWDPDGPWATMLRAAVRKRKVPIYFLQPRNGKHLDPTIALSHEAATTGNNEFQAAFFLPVVPNDGPEDVHSKFIGTVDRVTEWGPSVRDFFERYFIPFHP